MRPNFDESATTMISRAASHIRRLSSASGSKCVVIPFSMSRLSAARNSLSTCRFCSACSVCVPNEGQALSPQRAAEEHELHFGMSDQLVHDADVVGHHHQRIIGIYMTRDLQRGSCRSRAEPIRPAR